MEIDAINKVAAVTRTVSTVDRQGRPARVVVAQRRYPTSVEDLWDAITTAERIPRWFTPISGDLRLGGRYQLEGNAGGEVLICDPPRLLEVTWEYGGETSWVTVELTGEPGADGAVLELRHVAHVPDELWDQFGPGATGVGWDLALLGLDLHVSSGAAVDPVEVEAWQTSPNALDLIARSSRAWGEASVEGGTPRPAAEAAATRTTAFYTGSE
jgi:uncharacterized protein YndB with AHSA1/START domain